MQVRTATTEKDRRHLMASLYPITETVSGSDGTVILNGVSVADGMHVTPLEWLACNATVGLSVGGGYNYAGTTGQIWLHLCF